MSSLMQVTSQMVFFLGLGPITFYRTSHKNVLHLFSTLVIVCFEYSPDSVRIKCNSSTAYSLLFGRTFYLGIRSKGTKFTLSTLKTESRNRHSRGPAH